MRLRTSILLLFFTFIGLCQEGEIYVMIDSDIDASTLINGELNKIEGSRDQLIRYNLTSGEQTPLNIPNSVLSWTHSMILTSDGIIISCSPFGSAGDRVENVSSVYDLPKLTDVYMVDSEKMKLLDTKRVGNSPTSISLQSNQKKLAVATSDLNGKMIHIVETNDSQFKDILSLEYPSKSTISDISWSPDNQHLAVLSEESGSIIFYNYSSNKKETSITSTGGVINASMPVSGIWDNSGNYFISNDINEWVNNGNLIVIKPAFKSGKHEILDKIEVGKVPMALSFSPDNKYLVVMCMEGTFFPEDHPNSTQESTLYLFSFESGTLKLLDTHSSSAIFSSSISFQPDSLNFAISSFVSPDKKEFGEIQFYTIENESISDLPKKILTPRGAHEVIWSY